MYINGRWLIEPEVKAYIHKLEELNAEIRAEAERVMRKNDEMKKMLVAAMDSMNAIAENVREECEEYACGSCEYDSPMTEYGEMLYECPGTGNDSRCFKWKHADEALALIGDERNEP